MKYLRYFVVAFLATVCVNMMAVDITVDLALAKNATPNPPYGTIIGDSYSTGRFDGTGYSIGSDGNSIGWEISGSPYTITAIKFEGYINTTSTSKNWGFAFSSNGGQSWGSEVTQANDGTKNYHEITVSATIPAGTNAFKIIRRAGTSTKIRKITYTVAAACDGPTFTTQPSTAAAFYKVGATATALTVEASGTGVTYQWYSNSTASNTGGTAISNAKNASYTPSTTSAGTTYYYCEAKASDCAVATASNVSGAITVQAKSADASLSDLKVNGSTIAGFSATKTSYDITLPAGSGQPTVVPTAKDADATLGTVNISSPSANTYVATFSVTAEDGTPANYTINFTVDDGNPKITSFVVSGVTATINQTAHTITAELPNGTSLTSLTPTVTITNASSYSPTGAQNFSNPVTYTVGSVSYTVTLTVSQLSTDATLSSLIVAGKGNILQDGKLTYDIDVEASSSVPTVSFTRTDDYSTAVKTDATGIPGTTTIVVTAQDGKTKKTYTINFNVAVPPSSLSLHEPDVYDAPNIAGGYEAQLVNVQGREYEVYYINRDKSSNLTIATSYVDQAGSISDNQSTSNNTRTKDGWATIASNGTGGDSGTAPDEFGGKIRSAKLTNTSHALELRIRGFDQFSFYGKDNNTDASKNKMFEVYIDGVKQTRTPSDYAVNRFTISTGEHVIKVTGSAGAGDNKLCGFSLRVGNDPRTRCIKGNDSTQLVYQNTNISPIYYYTKYNQTTEVEWVGTQANGITLTTIPRKSGDVGDTVYLSGKANCPVGPYNYKIIPKKDGTSYGAVTGKFKVASKIDFVQKRDSFQKCAPGTAITPIQFRANFIDASQATLNWVGTAPSGISGRLDTGGDIYYYYLEGTPTDPGTYKYTITVDTFTVTGKIVVRTVDYTNSILYLCKNDYKYDDRNNGGSNGYDKFYDYLLITKGYNVIAVKANPEQAQEQSVYNKYQKMIVISEDVDPTNREAIAVARGDVATNLPVLNMQGFTYNEGNLGWGYANTGSRTNTKITVKEPNHPIFSGFGSTIEVLTSDPNYTKAGLAPIEVTKQHSACLAVAPMSNKTDYYADGDMNTVIHEVPKEDRGGQKYIAFPIRREACHLLSSTGKQLIDKIITYLTTASQVSPVVIPECKITSFKINGVEGVNSNTESDRAIRFQLKDIGPDVSAVIPVVTVASNKTWWEANPTNSTVLDDGKIEMDLSKCSSVVGVWVRVRDYINVAQYMVYVDTPTDVEEVYVDGDWYDVYDYMGRKVASTNESLSSIDLPHGMYIIRTARGTLKIFR